MNQNTKEAIGLALDIIGFALVIVALAAVCFIY